MYSFICKSSMYYCSHTIHNLFAGNVELDSHWTGWQDPHLWLDEAGLKPPSPPISAVVLHYYTTTTTATTYSLRSTTTPPLMGNNAISAGGQMHQCMRIPSLCWVGRTWESSQWRQYRSKAIASNWWLPTHSKAIQEPGWTKDWCDKAFCRKPSWHKALLCELARGVLFLWSAVFGWCTASDKNFYVHCV